MMKTMKSKTGRIIKVFPDKGKALVEGLNIVKRHTKPNRKNQQGGIVQKEAPIHLSNLLLAIPVLTVLLPTFIGYPLSVPALLVIPHLFYLIVFSIAVLLGMPPAFKMVLNLANKQHKQRSPDTSTKT